MAGIALLMNQNAYSGREYWAELRKRGVSLDVLSIGEFSEVDASEDARCGGLWTPPAMTELESPGQVFAFKSLKELSLIELVKEKKYDIGIQGGTGIIRRELMESFQGGILNFHPGRLPEYRGCSAPEWQVYEGNPVFSTCHLVDEGIDTGPIFAERDLGIAELSYHKMRSLVYPKTAQFVADVVAGLDTLMKDKSTQLSQLFEPQPNELAQYRKYIGDEKINELIHRG